MVLRPAPNTTSNAIPSTSIPTSIVEQPRRSINLLKGHPSPTLLPASLLSQASQRILSDPTKSTPALLYGADEGYLPLRASLAKWLEEFYGPAKRDRAPRPTGTDQSAGEVGIRPENITITGGASQSLALLLTTFTDPSYTQSVFLSVPAYFLAFKVFQDAGFTGRMRPVPEDEQGIDVDYLRSELAKLARSQAGEGKLGSSGGREGWLGFKPRGLYEKVYKHVIYAVPTFANPSSRTLSLSRRESLVELAREYDALIIADDVYDMLYWSRSRSSHPSPIPPARAKLPRLADIDAMLPDQSEYGNAISNGSFSKILGPGVRCGHVTSTPAFAHALSQTGCQRSGGSPSQYTSVCINDLIERGELQNHIGWLRTQYSRRWHLMRKAVRDHLEPLGVTIVEQKPEEGSEGMAGGYFIWLHLPQALSATKVTETCKASELVVAPGRLFEVPRLASLGQTNERGSEDPANAPANDFAQSIRLCFAYEDEDKLTEGVHRLARVIREIQKG